MADWYDDRKEYPWHYVVLSVIAIILLLPLWAVGKLVEKLRG